MARRNYGPKHDEIVKYRVLRFHDEIVGIRAQIKFQVDRIFKCILYFSFLVSFLHFFQPPSPLFYFFFWFLSKRVPSFLATICLIFLKITFKVWAVLNCNKLSYIIFFNFKRKRKTRYFIFEREAKQVNGIESQQRILEYSWKGLTCLSCTYLWKKIVASLHWFIRSLMRVTRYQ